MNTFQLQCFLEVADHLNFAQAARSLHVTHPAVSQQIRSLEDELGVKLFYRTTRTVRLTEEGQTFLPDARQIVMLLDRAKKRFDENEGEVLQTLSVGCYDFPNMFLLSPAFKKFKALCPHVRPRILNIPFRHIYQLLDRGNLDVVVGFKEPGDINTHAGYKELFKSGWVCLCADDHPLADRTEITKTDLENEKMILFAPPGILQFSQELNRLRGKRPMSDFILCESIGALMILAQAQYGVAVLPACLALENAGLRSIPMKGNKPISFGIYAKSLREDGPVRQFVQCCTEMLKDVDFFAGTE